MTDDDVLIDEKLPRMPLKTQIIKTKCDECEKLIQYIGAMRYMGNEKAKAETWQALSEETRKAIGDE